MRTSLVTTDQIIGSKRKYMKLEHPVLIVSQDATEFTVHYAQLMKKLIPTITTSITWEVLTEKDFNIASPEKNNDDDITLKRPRLTLNP